ncbi:MAG: hypothetical protein ACOYO2_06170 [Mycobacterium sp.]|jgi:hypothetical protein
MGLITGALKVRFDEPSEEFDRRMVAGAIVGVLIASSDGTQVPEPRSNAG